MTTWTHSPNEVSGSWTHSPNEVSATWSRVADEVSVAWSFLWSSLSWHTWENETTDNWSNWG
jgi:hypothetical protein